MKFLITIPLAMTKGKNSKPIPPRFYVTEAFNKEQALRRAGVTLKQTAFTVEALADWIERIEAI